MLKKYNFSSPIILAIPNGGIPVGLRIAKKLNAKFELIVVRKIQIPFNPEAGFGAVSPDNTVILNDEIVINLNFSKEEIAPLVEKTLENIKARIKEYGCKENFYFVNGKEVILVDDGLASGYTMLVAVRTVKKHNPKKIMVAVPTASSSAVKLLREEVSEIICPDVRGGIFFAVADAYENWYDLEKEEVLELLKKEGYFQQ